MFPILTTLLLLILPLAIFSILIYIYLRQKLLYPPTNTPPKQKSIAIIVLGDAHQSPRTLAHATSLLSHNYHIHLIAYNTPPSHLLVHPNASTNLTFTSLPTPQKPLQSPSHLLYTLSAIQTFLYRGYNLLHTLLQTSNTFSTVLLQNPPNLPTFFIIFLLKPIYHWNIIIDWHNLGFTIMKENGVPGFLVWLAKWYEILGGRLVGDMHLCVSAAMERWVRMNLGKEGVVVYDRPRGEWVCRRIGGDGVRMEKEEEGRMEFIERILGNCFGMERENVWVREECKVAVTCTSWTADEDFELFLSALKQVDSLITESRTKSKSLIVFITGRGPLRKHYEQVLLQESYSNIAVCTAWLAYKDYLRLLRSADVGISLHKSSSGIDLPMKVVDMFGSGLPVYSYEYNAIDELVLHGKNGRLFKDSDGLAGLLSEMFSENGSEELIRMQENLEYFAKPQARWDAYWASVVLPLFKKTGKGRKQ